MSTMTGAIQSVGIVGGGTAGFLTALALKKHLPNLRVDVIASSDIPVIGVGESTIFHLVDFLHEELGLDRAQLYREVRPTWKLGLRLFWGAKGQEAFNWPSDRVDHGAAHASGVDVRTGSLFSILMDQRKSFVTPSSDPHRPNVLKPRNHSYHLDNPRFVTYLQNRVIEAGVRIVDTRIEAVELNGETGEVTQLRSSDGRTFSYDLYVDCSGFRSLLLGRTLGVPFVSFRSSLFNNRAIAGEVPNGGRIKPYTEARTMPNGWVWVIPMRDRDHVGYVYSSDHADNAHAEEILRTRLGAELTISEIRFESGRRERAWQGNVVGVGNAAGFVEPLQSTAIQMIMNHARGICDVLRGGADWRGHVDGFNERMGAKWDFIRWLISLHYRFNKHGGESDFWRDCRAHADVSGFEPMVEHFRTRGLLTETFDEAGPRFEKWWQARFMGPHAIDILLLAMGETPAPGSLVCSPERHAAFLRRQQLWEEMGAAAFHPEEALPLVDANSAAFFP